jgi:hypothetical protein
VSTRDLNEALINGWLAVRWLFYTVTLKSDEEIDNAVSSVRRSAKIAAHYALAHLNQGGQVPRPLSQAAKERFLGMIQASIYGVPRALKSLEGGRMIHPSKQARPVSVTARKTKASKTPINERIPSPPIRAASEVRVSPLIHVSEEDWTLKRQRRLDLKTAQSVGLDATKAVLFCVRITDPRVFEVNLKALVADSILAARSAISYLDSGGRRLCTPSPGERCALRKKLEASAIGRLEVRSPTLEASSPELVGGELDDALGKIIRGALILKGCLREPTNSPELAEALGSIVRGARLSRDCIRKRNMFFGGTNASLSRNLR